MVEDLVSGWFFLPLFLAKTYCTMPPGQRANIRFQIVESPYLTNLGMGGGVVGWGGVGWGNGGGV